MTSRGYVLDEVGDICCSVDGRSTETISVVNISEVIGTSTISVMATSGTSRPTETSVTYL